MGWFNKEVFQVEKQISWCVAEFVDVPNSAHPRSSLIARKVVSICYMNKKNESRTGELSIT